MDGAEQLIGNKNIQLPPNARNVSVKAVEQTGLAWKDGVQFMIKKSSISWRKNSIYLGNNLISSI